MNEQRETRKFGPATQRLRVFIQKNFLKHSLEELENQNYQEIPMGFFILMQTFRDCIDLLLKKEYVDRRHPNLGAKYTNIDQNLYENKFL